MVSFAGHLFLKPSADGYESVRAYLAIVSSQRCALAQATTAQNGLRRLGAQVDATVAAVGVAEERLVAQIAGDVQRAALAADERHRAREAAAAAAAAAELARTATNLAAECASTVSAAQSSLRQELERRIEHKQTVALSAADVATAQCVELERAQQAMGEEVSRLAASQTVEVSAGRVALGELREAAAAADVRLQEQEQQAAVTAARPAVNPRLGLCCSHS